MPIDQALAHDLVFPIYDALTRPGEKDVEALIKSITSEIFQSCGNEGECAGRDAVIERFKGLADVIPDLHWSIKEFHVAGEDKIVVRGEATGTPIAPFLGNAPNGRSFRTMSIDLYTVADGKIAQSYHVENWTAALRQLSK